VLTSEQKLYLFRAMTIFLSVCAVVIVIAVAYALLAVIGAEDNDEDMD